jgi:hypothetical protein
LIKAMRLASVQPSHSFVALGRARVLHVPGADAEANADYRNYLLLAKPNLIMNDIRLRRRFGQGAIACQGGYVRVHPSATIMRSIAGAGMWPMDARYEP